MNTLCLNGELMAPEAAKVATTDHGLLVGDGAFETLKIQAGRPFALTRHLVRLDGSLKGLNLPAVPHATIADAVTKVIAANQLVTGRLRITVTSGPGPLGSDRSGAPLTWMIHVAPMPAWPASVDVWTCPWPRNERSPLAGLKTTSYAENVLALAQAKASGAGEAIFGNTRGELCEGTGSNVFIVRNGALLTPPLAAGCLAGVTRALVLEWCGGKEEVLPLSALASADEAFITSSTRDVQPIRAVDGQTLAACPGPVTLRAQALFAERAAAAGNP